MPAIDVETTTAPRRMPLLNGGGSSRLSLSICLPDPADEPLTTVVVALSRLLGQIVERSLFSGMWLLIACVSSFDAYLTIRFRDSLYYEELNPLARYLLHLDGWDPSLLISMKFLGSILVLAFVAGLHNQNRRLGLIVTAALASFQAGLLGYLTLV
ncbi:MAG TPA: DUF5658 family protein [Planctomycetaceae bacterium]|jgi:hypothetical protein